MTMGQCKQPNTHYEESNFTGKALDGVITDECTDRWLPFSYIVS